MSLRRPEPWRRPTLRAHAGYGLALLAALAAVASGPSASAVGRGAKCPGQDATHVRPQDQLVLINSRPIGCSTDNEQLATGLVAMKYDPVGLAEGRKWVETSWQEVVAWNDPTVATVVYVHGNRISKRDAPGRGMYVYRHMVRCARDDRPVRFIIWSWPSTQIEGMLMDYRVKAARTRPVAYQLAWLVRQMPPEMPIGFLGYSYGARVESGAAHLLAGGSLGGLQLEEAPSIDRPTEHVYMAPAFEEGWLAPCRFHGLALKRIDNLLTTVNPRDPAMKFYPLLSKQIKENAMGFDGPKGLPRRYASRVRMLNVKGPVGRSHDLCDYVKAPGLMAMAWRRLTFADRQSTINSTPESSSVAVVQGSGH